MHDGSVFTAQRDLEVAHIVVQFNFFAEAFPLLGSSVKVCIHIQAHQRFPVRVPEHANERVIAVQQIAVRSGNENAFLHLLEKEPVFFFCRVRVGDVANHMDGSLLRAPLLHVGR